MKGMLPHRNDLRMPTHYDGVADAGSKPAWFSIKATLARKATESYLVMCHFRKRNGRALSLLSVTLKIEPFFFFFVVSYVEERSWRPIQNPNKGRKKGKAKRRGIEDQVYH